MNEQKFKAGDVVELKSGSLSMTVVRYSKNDPEQVWVIYYNGDFNHLKFEESCLKLAESIKS